MEDASDSYTFMSVSGSNAQHLRSTLDIAIGEATRAGVYAAQAEGAPVFWPSA